jgi:hypothetical protein
VKKILESDFQMGSRSLFSVAFLALMFLVALFNDQLSIQQVQQMGPWTLVSVGLFSTLLSIGFSNFFKVSRTSESQIRISKRPMLYEGETPLLKWKDILVAFGPSHLTHTQEINPSFRVTFTFFSFIFLALIIFKPTTLSGLNISGSSFWNDKYCSDTEVLIPDTKQSEGCQLIYRAVELGYAKNLGSCAPKETDIKICELRQKDEPLLHYVWRTLEKNTFSVVQRISSQAWNDVVYDFSARIKKIESNLNLQSHTLSATPKASHHIWTNLPYPGNTIEKWWKATFSPDHCLSEYQKLPNSLKADLKDPLMQSKSAQFVMGQLLFNPKHSLPAIPCREVHIHWSASLNSCERLIKDAPVFLSDQNILQSLNTLFSRARYQDEHTELQAHLQSTRGPVKIEQKRKQSDLQRYVSFQCAFFTDQPVKKSKQRAKMSLFNASFEVRTAFITNTDQAQKFSVETYEGFSQLLAPNFKYGSYLSNQDLGLAPDFLLGPSQFENRESAGMYFTNLEYLKDADLFLDQQWLRDHNDLMEVFPHHLNLHRYVGLFRNSYRTHRGRL